MKYSVVNYSQIDKNLFRIEAEYYSSEYLSLETKMANNPRLVDSSHQIVCGPFGATLQRETYTDDGVKVIRPFNIKDYQIERENIVYIPSSDIEKKQLKTFTRGTIFFSRVGDIKCGIFLDDEVVTISPNLIAVDIKKQNYNPYFLTLFFNSKYGFLQIQRELKVSAQPTISTKRLADLKLPLTSILFQDIIGSIFEQARELILSADRKYKKTEQILLSELELIDWHPKHQLTFIKYHSDIKESRRMDAEYFQPKYDDIVNAIESYSGGWDTLGNLTIIKKEDYKPQNDEQYKYIELSNVGKSGEIMECMVKEGRYLPSRAKRKITTDDVIVSSIEGSLSSIAIIENEYNQALCSTGFHIISSEFMNSETLLMLLKSVIGQLQLKKGCSGTILTAISDSEFNKIVLPKIKKVTQTKIQQNVIQSLALRKQSKHLLECAKRAVEIAIEEDEKTALAWLKKETQE